MCEGEYHEFPLSSQLNQISPFFLTWWRGDFQFLWLEALKLLWGWKVIRQLLCIYSFWQFMRFIWILFLLRVPFPPKLCRIFISFPLSRQLLIRNRPQCFHYFLILLFEFNPKFWLEEFSWHKNRFFLKTFSLKQISR